LKLCHGGPPELCKLYCWNSLPWQCNSQGDGSGNSKPVPVIARSVEY
jgi:hypothetical protein